MRMPLIIIAFFAVSTGLGAVERGLPAPSGEDIVSPDAQLELLFTRSAKIQGGLTEGPHHTGVAWRRPRLPIFSISQP